MARDLQHHTTTSSGCHRTRSAEARLASGVGIRSYASTAEPNRGIVLVLGPKQPDGERPFLIARIVDADTGRLREIVFGYAERRRANAEPLGVRDLQELLRAGRRFGEIDTRFDRLE